MKIQAPAPSKDSEIAKTILDAFTYWDTVPPLSKYTTVDHLESEYTRQSGPNHWFDADTLRYFGSRNREMVAAGILVERQTKAPEGCPRYSVTAWIIDEAQPRDHRRMGRIVPKKIAAFNTRAKAVAFGKAAAQLWNQL